MTEFDARRWRPPTVKFVRSRPVPRAVQLAVVVLLASLAYGFVTLYASAFDSGVDTGPFWPAVLVLILSALALNLLIALALYAGRNWARILLTVLTALAIPTFVFNAVNDGPPTPLDWIDQLVGLFVVVLLWRSTSSSYFRQMRADRAAHKASNATLRSRPLR